MREFGYLNKKINEHVVDLEKTYKMPIEEYLEFMSYIYKFSDDIAIPAGNYFNENRKKVYDLRYKIGLSYEETIRIILKFLNTIDPSLCDIFNQLIEDGTIIFQNEKELKKLQISKENFYYFYNLAGIHNGKKIINIILKNNISDIFTIVHEFTHYLSIKTLNEKSITWLHFTEGYSRTFEILLLKYLSSNQKFALEAKKYYIELMYYMCLRIFEFRKEFVCFDIFCNYGSFTPQKVIKYCSAESLKEKNATNILNGARISERYMLETSRTLREYLEDSRYVLAILFSNNILDSFFEFKAEILEDIFTLEEKSYEYYFDKYDLEKSDNYQKIFRI